MDDLKEISKPALREGLESFRSLIVLLNDETADSEWCRYEWAYCERRGLQRVHNSQQVHSRWPPAHARAQVALELEMPCKVVVDLERCGKKTRQALLDEALEL